MDEHRPAPPALLDIGALAELLTAQEADAAHEIVGAVLASVRQFLGMEVAFVGEFTHGTRLFRFVDAGFDNCPVHTGGSDPLEETYCSRVVDGRLPGLITDASALSAAADLAVTTEFPVGAHLSVPIVFSTGRVYGTFCAFSRTPDPTLRDRDLGVMQMLAQLLGGFLERAESTHRRRATLGEEIVAIITGRRVTTVFQPIVDLHSRRQVGFEALSRFPAGRPEEWFAHAEEVGLGVQLELAAFEQVLSHLDDVPGAAYVAVNFSPAALCCPELLTRCEGLPLDRLVFELTEHTDVADDDALGRRVAWLRARGARVALDDAGSGYAGLQRILSLAPDILKLDLQLTRGVVDDPARQALVRALCWYAASTGALLVAEGIEDERSLDMLRLLGVRYGQGYHLGMPAPLGLDRSRAS